MGIFIPHIEELEELLTMALFHICCIFLWQRKLYKRTGENGCFSKGIVGVVRVSFI